MFGAHTITNKQDDAIRLSINVKAGGTGTTSENETNDEWIKKVSENRNVHISLNRLFRGRFVLLAFPSKDNLAGTRLNFFLLFFRLIFNVGFNHMLKFPIFQHH